MFISKKNYEKALAEQEAKINLEWEKRSADREESRWHEQRVDDFRNEVRMRCNEIEKRISALEKAAGIAEEKHVCPFEPKTSRF